MQITRPSVPSVILGLTQWHRVSKFEFLKEAKHSTQVTEGKPIHFTAQCLYSPRGNLTFSHIKAHILENFWQP